MKSRNLNHKAAVIVAILALTALIAAIVFITFKKNSESLPASLHYGSALLITGAFLYATLSSIRLTLRKKNGQINHNKSSGS